MPDLAEQDFNAELGLGADDTATAVAPIPVPATNGLSLAPLTADELAKTATKAQVVEQGRPRQVEMMKGATPDLATKLGARPGIPFDISSGVPFLSRMRMSVQPSDEESFKALQKQYGEANVRKNALGWPIVTMRDEAGKQKDVLANPIGIDWEDVSGVLSALPEIGGSLLSILATKGRTLAPGVINALKTLAITAGGAELAGAAKDVAVRALEGEPVQPGEVAGRRGAMAAVDVTAGGALGVGAKVLGTAVSPFSKFGPMQQKAREAQDYIFNKHGVYLPMTPGEATGSGILQRTEAMEAQKPGSSTAFQRFLSDRYKQIEDLRNIIMGGAAPEEEAAGQKFLASAGAKLAPAEFEAQQAASEAAGEATKEITAGIGPKVPKTAVGQSIRQRAMDARAAFKATDKANYDAFYSHPLAEANIVDADVIAQPIQDLMKRFPKVEETTIKPSKLLDPFGNPISIPVTEERVLAKSIPSGIQARLEELASTEGGKISLASLKEIRTDVSNAIAEGEAIPGVKPGYLKAAEKALSDAINKGLKQINDPTLTSLWDTATAYHKANVGKFERAGIAELFRVPSQPNYLGDTELVSRVSEGKKAQDVYAAYRDFFGANSAQMQGIKQSIRDDTLGLSDLSETIDAKGFIRRLENLSNDAPEVMADVFGPNAKSLRSSAVALLGAQGETLPKEELAALANSGNLSAGKIAQMLSAQAKRDDLYRNDLFRAIAAGNVKPEKIQPTEVVNRLVFSPKTQPDQLKGLVSLINDRPDVLEDLRRLTFKRVLDDATIVAPSGERIVGAKELEQALTDENLSKRLKTVLGQSTFDDLVQLKNFLKPGSVAQQAAKSAGGISAGQQISGMVERGDLSYVGRAVKNFLLATVYTSPSLRTYFANTALSSQDKALLVGAAVASTPMVEAITRTYTKEGAKAVAAQLSRAGQQTTQGPTPGTADIPWDEFLQQLNQK